MIESLAALGINSAMDDVNLLFKKPNKPFNLAPIFEVQMSFRSTRESESHTQLRLVTWLLTSPSERLALLPWNQVDNFLHPIAEQLSSFTPFLHWPHLIDVFELTL